jgi:hypothetical protein
MTWGPGKNPVLLLPGDEVPAPVKRIHVQNGHIAAVEEVSGKPWKDQPEESQRLWAEHNGKTFLSTRSREEPDKPGATPPDPVVVEVRSHPTRRLEEGEDPFWKGTKPSERKPAIEVKNTGKAADTARQAPKGVAGGEVGADEPAPPTAESATEAEPPSTVEADHRSNRRGRRSRR